jgi:uncharacterized protein (TIGR03437 family)
LRKYTTISVLLFSAFSLHAQNFIDGQAARAELGQYTFTFGGVSPGSTPGTFQILPNQQIFGAMSGLAWANGTLYIADSNRLALIPEDNRVLMVPTNQIPGPYVDLTNASSFSIYQCNLCAFPASNQVGQPGFGALNQPSPSSPDAFPIGLNNTQPTSNMRSPTAVASDGRVLVVADTDNNRVLIWNEIPSTINQPADLVLGQADFTHAVVAPSPNASSFRAPQGVWVQNGKLFVADTDDSRILIWNTFPTSNNQPADIALGQPSLTSGTPSACSLIVGSINVAANTLCSPVSVTSDGVHLYVSDLGYNRVLIWNSIPTSTGQSANVVVGQPNMTSMTSNNSAPCSRGTGRTGLCEANLNFPRYALSDGTRLFIADGGNDRVLIFNSIPTTNGALADSVLGQPNTGVDNISSTSISIASTAVDNTSAVDVTPSPTSLAFDGLNLYVSDPIDNRVLVFTPGNTPLPPSSAVNWASEIIRQEGVVSIIATTINAGDTVTVTLGTKMYVYTVKSGDTSDTIAQGLVSAINAGNGDPNAIAIFAGTGTGALYLSSRGTNLPYDSIAFSVTASNTTNITATASGNGYLTSGTAATGAPGMLIAINGTSLSDVPADKPVMASLTGTIPTSLGGTQVFLDGVASPVYSASSSEVVSQIPYNFNTRNSTSIYIRTTHTDGSVTVTNATPIYIAPANPGIFSAPISPGQARPWPVSGAYHQPGNPQVVVDLTGTVNAGDVLTIKVGNNSYSYTVQSGDSLNSVTANLAQAINKGNDPNVTATVGGAFNRVVVVARKSGAAGTNIPVSTSTSSSAKITLTAYTSATCCAVASGSPITNSNPAVSGETITISAAGLGNVQDTSGHVIAEIPTGQPYSLNPTNSASASVSATLGGSTAQVVSAGLPQGSYGIYQVQLIVPEQQAQNSNTPLYIAQNAFISNTVTLPVGAANSNPFQPPPTTGSVIIGIDNPTSSSPALTGSNSIAGWAVGDKAVISSVTISVDGLEIAPAIYGGSRPDVCARHANSASCANGNVSVGYNYALDTTQFADGVHTLQITAVDANGDRSTQAVTFNTSNYTGSRPTSIGMDSPGAAGGTFQGVSTFSGWAANNSSAISSLQAYVDGVSRGNASYGLPRPDVCAHYPLSPSCQNGSSGVGWRFGLDTSTLANGNHVFAVSATAQNGDHTIQAHTFTVANWTTANSIVVNIDRPSSQNQVLSGSLNIGGWAINPVSPIQSVSIAVDSIPLGDADYGGNRADACVNHQAPDCPHVGWNFHLDTTLLGDGAHTLQVAFTPVSGQAYTATVPFQVANLGTQANPTRVSIDRPNNTSPPFSGAAAFGGWALNASSPVSTVQILVDGVSNGYAIYGGDRPDVCAKFSSANCPNVGWNYLLDTSVLTNGAHALQVTMTAENGQRASAGATFTVSNGPVTSPTSVVITQPNPQITAYQGTALFSGSATSSSAALTSIAISVDGYPYGSAAFTPGGVNSSVPWTYSLNTAQIADGTHTLGVTVTAADGSFAVASASFLVANWKLPSPTRVNIDTPNSFSTPFSEVAAFGGWAVDPNSPISSITIAIDDISFGPAQYGGDRADACKNHSTWPGCPNVGWNYSVDTTVLANGQHTLAVTATTAAGQNTTVTSSFTVAN